MGLQQKGFREEFLEGVLRRGSQKGLSRRCLERPLIFTLLLGITALRLLNYSNRLCKFRWVWSSLNTHPKTPLRLFQTLVFFVS